MTTIYVLRRQMPILWPWVSIFSLCFYVTNVQVVQHTVLNPVMKMGYFINNWPSDLVLEVESVIEKLVSCFLLLACWRH